MTQEMGKLDKWWSNLKLIAVSANYA